MPPLNIPARSQQGYQQNAYSKLDSPTASDVGSLCLHLLFHRCDDSRHAHQHESITRCHWRVTGLRNRVANKKPMQTFITRANRPSEGPRVQIALATPLSSYTLFWVQSVHMWRAPCYREHASRCSSGLYGIGCLHGSANGLEYAISPVYHSEPPSEDDIKTAFHWQ